MKTYFSKKKYLIIKSVSIVIFCILAVAVFAPFCLLSHHDNHHENNQKCLFSAHSFTYVDNNLSLLLILPFLGIFFLISNIIIPEGFILSPYRPPRLHL